MKQILYSFTITAALLFSSKLHADCPNANIDCNMCDDLVCYNSTKIGTFQYNVGTCGTFSCDLCKQYGPLKSYNSKCNQKFSACQGKCIAVLSWGPGKKPKAR